MARKSRKQLLLDVAKALDVGPDLAEVFVAGLERREYSAEEIAADAARCQARAAELAEYARIEAAKSPAERYERTLDVAIQSRKDSTNPAGWAEHVAAEYAKSGLKSVVDKHSDWERREAAAGASDLKLAAEVGQIPKAETTAEQSKAEVVPGGIILNGSLIELSGKPLAVVAFLAAAKHQRATMTELQNAVWQGDPTEQGTVRTAISTARAAIKAGLNLDHDPLPNIDRGPAVAWKLSVDPKD